MGPAGRGRRLPQPAGASRSPRPGEGRSVLETYGARCEAGTVPGLHFPTKPPHQPARWPWAPPLQRRRPRLSQSCDPAPVRFPQQPSGRRRRTPPLPFQAAHLTQQMSTPFQTPGSQPRWPLLLPYEVGLRAEAPPHRNPSVDETRSCPRDLAQFLAQGGESFVLAEHVLLEKPAPRALDTNGDRRQTLGGWGPGTRAPLQAAGQAPSPVGKPTAGFCTGYKLRKFFHVFKQLGGKNQKDNTS